MGGSEASRRRSELKRVRKLIWNREHKARG